MGQAARHRRGEAEDGSRPGAVVFDAIAHARCGRPRAPHRRHRRTPAHAQAADGGAEEGHPHRREGREHRAGGDLLVVDATTGQNGIAQAKAFGEAVNVTGLVLAKLDGTAKGGITFAVERELGIPVKAVGVGERDRDLVPFEPEAFVDAILGTEKGE